MTSSRKSAGEGLGKQADAAKKTSSKFAKRKNKSTFASGSDEGEVLLSLPMGFKYKLPGKRQRVVVGGIVIGLNLLLVVASIAYFYVPAFHDFIYNVGR